LVGLAVVVLAAGAAAAVVLHPWAGSGGSAAVPLVAASLDPDAPSFPVPAGSKLLNAQVEGSGTAAYRLAAWQSGQDYAATVAYYSSLADSRWHLGGSPSSTPQATDLVLTDSQGVFAEADVEIDRTDPVRIEVRFIPPGGAPAYSFAPGPTIAFGQLPAATALPDGFPTAFVPAGTTLYNASSIGSSYFAVFAGSVDPAAYLAQIKAMAPDAHAASTGSVTTIDFTYDGQPGEATVDAASGQVSVEVTK
jgi:hypothetical protein